MIAVPDELKPMNVMTCEVLSGAEPKVTVGVGEELESPLDCTVAGVAPLDWVL